MNLIGAAAFLLTSSVLMVSCDKSFYDFSVHDKDGAVVQLSKFKGKVLLIVNVASYCGYTQGHYHELRSLKEQLGDQFEVLAFPCNQFGAQEPEDVGTIIRNMKSQFDINFEIFGKIEVVGDNVPDFWQFLNDEAETVPTWNFFKYLVDADGQVWGAWGPNRSAQSISPYIVQAVEQTSKHSKPNADEL